MAARERFPKWRGRARTGITWSSVVRRRRVTLQYWQVCIAQQMFFRDMPPTDADAAIFQQANYGGPRQATRRVKEVSFSSSSWQRLQHEHNGAARPQT